MNNKTMKKQMKRIVAVVLLGGAIGSAQAQYYDTKNEVSISFGAGANSEIIGSLADFTEVATTALLTTSLTGGIYTGNIKYDNESYTSPIAVGYYRHLTKLIAVGGYVGYNSVKRDMLFTGQFADGSNKKDYRIGEAKRTNISLMPSAKFHWVRTKNFGFYSKVGVGLTISKEKQEADKKWSDTSTYFNWDVTPIGLDAGTPQFRAFAELGMGEQGIVCAGLRYKF